MSESVEGHERSLQGMSLPQRFYVGDEIYERDVRWLRENMWFMVGHESQIPHSGDYFLYAFDKDSIILIRDAEGQVRAHQNVCRHRGSRICSEETGNARVLTCPYHAWSYESTGMLRGAPGLPEGLDRNVYALLSCHVRVSYGLIFLSFAERPPDFTSYISSFSQEFELQGLQHAKVARREMFGASANWKLLVENNLECYHCRPAHATYCAAHPGNSFGSPRKESDRTGYENVATSLSGLESEKARGFRPIYGGPNSQYFSILDRQLIGKNVVTESVGGKAVAPLMGQNTFDGVQTLALPSPLTSAALNPDYAVFYTFTPRSVRRTDIEVIWLVRETAIEGVDFHVGELSAVWEPTLREDKALVESVQSGVESTAYRPGPIALTEKSVGHFDRWYLERVAEGA